MGQLRDRYLQLGDVKVHYVESTTQGQTVVLLHGGSADAAHVSWGPVMASWAPHFRLVAPDFPGYGESSQPPWPGSVASLTRFLEDFTAALNLDRFALVGLSMGGMVAINFALNRPDRIQRLVLVDSAGLDKRIRWIRLIYPTVRAKPLYTLMLRLRRFACTRPRLVRFGMRQIMCACNPPSPELMEAVSRELRRPGLAWQAFLENELCWSGFRHDFSAKLGRIQAPTLIVHGENDPIIAVAHARKAHLRIPNSTLRVFANCGHWPPREKPEQFSRTVLQFLRPVCQTPLR